MSKTNTKYEISKLVNGTCALAEVPMSEVESLMAEWRQKYGYDADAWIQAWSDKTGYCEHGLSGVHLSYYITIGDYARNQYYKRIGKPVGRSCPAKCKWSKDR